MTIVGELYVAIVDCKDDYFRKGDLLLCCKLDTIKDNSFNKPLNERMIHTAINVTQNQRGCYFYDKEVEPA